LEGAFGKAEVDTGAPALVTLFLRQPDGTLSATSLLAEQASESPAWAVGGVTHDLLLGLQPFFGGLANAGA
jgi:hypothetical protein